MCRLRRGRTGWRTFCPQCGASLGTVRPQKPAARPTPAEGQAERRPISVMFCDLIDFTPMSARLDPEDLQAIIREYQSRTAAAVARYGGFIARYVGDGVLVYFGWPEAREGDAERAVRAGLGVVAAIGAAPVQGERLRVRIGIASGIVVVGETVGTGEAQQQTVMGETPNRAARLQALSEPDSVVIDTSTRQQIGRLFECRDLGAHALKGLPEPVPVWVVLGESAVVSRFEALHEARPAPMIGRDEELDLLLRRWRQAANGEGRMVLISGEPGIGKSRLVAALQEQIAQDPHVELRYFCAPHAQEDTLRPIIARWEQEAGFARGDTAEDRLSKLEAILPPETSPEDVALLADMLGVACGTRYPELHFSPQRKRERLFAAVNRRLAERTRNQPVLMIWEDMHWADPTSVELLETTMRLLPELPLLLVATFRPEFQTPWVGHAGVTLLALSRLGQRESAAVATQVMLGHALPSATLDRIVAQTDGVPLFIEELTKAVLEGAGTSDTVPDTLKGSLMARLDRLSTARQVAQVGAVIGREFSYGLLAAVAGLSESAIGQGLDQLVASGLAFRKGIPPDAVYRFKHALVQDTAYESLLRSRRAELHAAVAGVLESDPDIAAREPALLGYHFAHGGLIDRAATYFRDAGERAAERSAITETLAHLRRGLSLVEAMPDNVDRRRLEAELLIARGQIRVVIGGQADQEMRADYERALLLCRDLNNADLTDRAMSGVALNMMHRGEFALVRRFEAELATWTDLQNDSHISLSAHLRSGSLDTFQGQFVAARKHMEFLRFIPAKDWLQTVVGSQPFASAYLSVVLGVLGFLDESAAVAGQSEEKVQELSVFQRSVALAPLLRQAYVTRDGVALKRRQSAMALLAHEQGYSYYVATARCHLGWLMVANGDTEGIAELEAGVTTLAELSILMHGPYFRLLFAEALVTAGKLDRALATLDQALAISAQTTEAWLDAELHCRRGEVLFARGKSDEAAAERQFLRAVEIARDQSAKLWELRASMALARLWRDQGRRSEAHNLLAPIFNWFTEGFDKPDLAEGRDLLAGLQQ